MTFWTGCLITFLTVPGSGKGEWFSQWRSTDSRQISSRVTSAKPSPYAVSLEGGWGSEAGYV